MANDKATWQNVNIETLPPSIRKPYDAYKAKYREMKEAREAFEAALSAAIDPPKGKRVVFGYNFGKLSVAVVDDDKARAKPSSAVALADLIKR